MKRKFYTQTWFIVLLMFFWPMIIPGVISIALIFEQRKNDKVKFGQYEKLNDLTAEINRLKNLADAKKSQLDKIDLELEDEITKLQNNFKNKKQQLISNFENKENELNKILDSKENKLNELNHSLELLNKEYVANIVDDFVYDDISSEEIKNELALIKIQEKDLIKNNRAVIFNKEIDTKREANNNRRQILRCFDSEAFNIISNVTTKNIDTSRNKLVKSFEVINNMFKTSGFELSNEMLEIKLQELNFTYNFDLKKQQEAEIQKAIREQILEEEKVMREIEDEKRRIEKEEAQFNNEVKKLMSYMQKTDNDVEKNLYIEKIRELEEKLNALEKDKENVFDREANTRAGFVYIISNIGSFGENIYKIGMTRRLEPMDRVKELASASVPFEFDVHAMIFSEDAPALENMLHKEFKEFEVNKVNPRKEFFKVDLEKIREIVLENYSEMVDFTMEAPAEEYRESLKLENEIA